MTNAAALVIRPERPGDAAGIRGVHRGAFPTPAEADLVEALRATRLLSLSLVADRGGEIVGHVGFSPVTLPAHEAPGRAAGLGLAPLGVLPACQRAGAGSALVTAGLAAARAAGAGFVVLLGDPGYYHRFGFAAAARWRLCDEYGGGPHLQVVELAPGAIPPVGGLIRYAPPFAAFS
jgi:putative acetyltransferase